MSGWGWQDTGQGASLGGRIWFETTGTETIRIQTREDEASVDQIVISSDRYLNEVPGSSPNDNTILVAVP